MHVLEEKSKCSGCHACYSACPKRCITMQADSEGFLQPEIDEKVCVSCGKCKAVCPVLQEKDTGLLHAYGCVSKNDDSRMQSSSGGVFSMLATCVLRDGGIVYGAALGEDLSVKHVLAENAIELEKLRGSKYVQSRIGDVYVQIKEQLEQGRIVLFTGTPCQISGLKHYLGKSYENLILADVICHGAPSPETWKIWLKQLEKRYGASPDTSCLPKFRGKENGWRRYTLSVQLRNGKTVAQTLWENSYLRAFSANLSLRTSCYQCHAKGIARESDITMADFWGVEKLVPSLDDNKGTSLILINTEKGKKLFEKIADEMNCVEVEREAALAFNTSSYLSASRPANRELFFKLLSETDFETAVNKCVPKCRLRKYINKAKSIVKRMCKRYVQK